MNQTGAEGYTSDTIKMMKEQAMKHSRRGQSNDQFLNWENIIVLAFIVFVLAIRVLARKTLLPPQHPLPPKETLELFRPNKANNAFDKLEKNEDNQISLKLKTKIKITSDTYIFRFEFPDVEMSLGLPIG